MSQPSVPISFPIKTLKDLESRAYFDSFHYPFNKASVPLEPSSLPNRRRLLVCHDMAGGNGDDTWVQGGTKGDAFDLSHWYLMDIFVYFSHDLVTLPPPCWTNAAHLHGVKVLGTFITEGEEGTKVAYELVSTKESARMYAERLTELALALGFDGWLLNMEISLPSVVNLKEFVSDLTKTMHSQIPGSLVIWYDSITVNGNLDCQNQLNDQNKPFFDLCDGIFENNAEHSAAFARDRRYDVYMGIDVFRRAQWHPNDVLDLLKKVGVSAVVFAPGCIYEDPKPPLKAPEHQTVKTHWWGLVEKSWGVAQNCLKALPFYSNFIRATVTIFLLMESKFLVLLGITFLVKAFSFKEQPYSGGSCITVKGHLSHNGYVLNKLFEGDILIGDSPIRLAYSVKLARDSLLDIYAVLANPHKESVTVIFASDGSHHPEGAIKARRTGSRAAPLGWVLQEYEISSMSGHRLTQIGAGSHRPGGHRAPTDYHAALGHVSVNTSDHQTVFPPSGSWLVRGEFVEWDSGASLVSAKIAWKLERGRGGEVSWLTSYNVYAQMEGSQPGQEPRREFLGVARVEGFYVERFAVPSGVSGVDFVIQPCAADGSSQKVEESPVLHLRKP